MTNEKENNNERLFFVNRRTSWKYKAQSQYLEKKFSLKGEFVNSLKLLFVKYDFFTKTI